MNNKVDIILLILTFTISPLLLLAATIRDCLTQKVLHFLLKNQVICGRELKVNIRYSVFRIYNQF